MHFCLKKRKLDFQFTGGFFAFFEPSKCFIPRRDVCLQTPEGVQLLLLMLYIWVRKTLDYFLLAVFRLFWTLKIFYPPKGAQCGPFWFFPCYCGMRRVFDTFKIPTFRRPFWILTMFYPPKGRLPVDSSRRPIVFYVCLILF